MKRDRASGNGALEFMSDPDAADDVPPYLVRVTMQGGTPCDSGEYWEFGLRDVLDALGIGVPDISAEVTLSATGTGWEDDTVRVTVFYAQD